MAEVEYDIRDRIAYITLNRPEKLNAINPEMRQLLWDAFRDVDSNPEIRVAIITGTGRGLFDGPRPGGHGCRPGQRGPSHLGPLHNTAKHMEAHHLGHQRYLPGPGMWPGPGQ